MQLDNPMILHRYITHGTAVSSIIVLDNPMILHRYITVICVFNFLFLLDNPPMVYMNTWFPVPSVEVKSVKHYLKF